MKIATTNTIKSDTFAKSAENDMSGSVETSDKGEIADGRKSPVKFHVR